MFSLFLFPNSTCSGFWLRGRDLVFRSSKADRYQSHSSIKSFSSPLRSSFQTDLLRLPASPVSQPQLLLCSRTEEPRSSGYAPPLNPSLKNTVNTSSGSGLGPPALRAQRNIKRKQKTIYFPARLEHIRRLISQRKAVRERSKTCTVYFSFCRYTDTFKAHCHK